MSKAHVRRIKSMHWDQRVRRPGFLQSKTIVNQAEVKPLRLTKSVSVTYDNVFWVNELNIYDEDATQTFAKAFDRAFREDKRWSQSVMKFFRGVAPEVKTFASTMAALERNPSRFSAQKKRELFGVYVQLLERIQQYYIIAVPLTAYCESKLHKRAPALLEHAWSYEPLDVDRYNQSIINIKRSRNNAKRIAEHLRTFAWIKTTYNSIQAYTKGDLRKELASDVREHHKQKLPKSEYLYLLHALQIGIYARNRMKELSQQVWYAFDPLAKALATDLGLTREQFLQLTPAEVEASLQAGKSVVSKTDINQRNKGFAIGILDNQEVLIVGPDVRSLDKFFNTVADTAVQEVTGSPACRGVVRGSVKVILNHSQFSKLQQGDILVTSMTTPDYIVIMKKAGAFVTDEGGLSCHAAVVSRELQIPCIIGTKTATHVLHDGDWVEVNATRGVVRILKRAKK
jgi:phosphohistidine swiveling domain-containing protein